MQEKQSIKAVILADSIERIGNNRITTWQLTYPRFIHSELMTHRILSKNSASSRAIPFNKMVEQVENDPFIPIKWMKEHKGMQGTEYLIEDEIKEIEFHWLNASKSAIHQAKNLNTLRLTKQIVNRLLEPFLWHTIILTGTEFENFFALRAHPMAEIHLQDLAYKMLEVYNASTPKELKEGEWHIPFENEISDTNLVRLFYEDNFYTHPKNNKEENLEVIKLKLKIATAKCAQVSYMKFGSDDYADLIDLHDSLFIRPYNGKRGIREINDPIHASPAEHIAQAMTEEEYQNYRKGYTTESFRGETRGWCHNLRGFKSYRSMLPNENSSDSRIIKK